MKNDFVSVCEIADKKRSKYFPLKKGKIEIVPVQYEELLPFIDKHFNKIFTYFTKSEQVKFSKKQLAQRKALFVSYRKIHWECFFYKYDGKIVGWFMGEMDDNETFYLRNVGILPAYRNKKIYSLFLQKFLIFLEEIGYQRVSSHHAPDNGHIYHLQLKSGFMIVGSEAHERFGQLVKMIKIFDPKRNEIFKKRYC